MTGRDSLFKVAWNSTLSKRKIQKNPSTAQERSGRSWRRLNKQKFDSANTCRQLNACTFGARVIRLSVPRKIQFTGSRRVWLITDMNSDEWLCGIVYFEKIGAIFIDIYNLYLHDRYLKLYIILLEKISRGCNKMLYSKALLTTVINSCDEQYWVTCE